MGRPLSTDIRLRLVRGVEDGDSRRGVAAQFDVAPSTAVRVVARFEATGSVEPVKQGRPPGSGKLGPHKDFLIAQVGRTPDITMAELAAVLETECGVDVDPTCIGKLLRAAGFTYKKNAAGQRARAQRRESRAA